MFGRTTGYVLVPTVTVVLRHIAPRSGLLGRPHSRTVTRLAHARASVRPEVGVGQRRLMRLPMPIVSIACRRALETFRRHRRAGAVGQSGHHLEVGGDGGGVDHERLVGLRDERGPGGGELDVVGAAAGAGEAQQGVTVLEADARAGRRRRLPDRGADRSLRCSN